MAHGMGRSLDDRVIVHKVYRNSFLLYDLACVFHPLSSKLRPIPCAIQCMAELQRKRCSQGKIAAMSQQQRTLHPLEGIVAGCALFLVLALTVGFAQAATD